MYLLGFGNIRVNVKIDPIVIEMCGFFRPRWHCACGCRADGYLHGYVPSNLSPERSEVIRGARYQVLQIGLRSVIHS